MAAPVAYRTSSNDKPTGSFPPIIYYRDTLGLSDRAPTDWTGDSAASSDSGVGPSRSQQHHQQQAAQMNIAHPNVVHGGVLADSMLTTNVSQSYHVEQIEMSRVLVRHPRALLAACLVALAAAIELLMFSVLSLFFDGAPYRVGPLVAGLLLIDSLVLLFFLKCYSTRPLLLLSVASMCLSAFAAAALFVWTTQLVRYEDARLQHRPDDTELRTMMTVEEEEESEWDREKSNNELVASTRATLYSLQLLFAPVHAIAAIVACVLLVMNWRRSRFEDGTTQQAYFLSQPDFGHQKILVPIELRQVRTMPNEQADNVSMGVQTSGSVIAPEPAWTA